MTTKKNRPRNPATVLRAAVRQATGVELPVPLAQDLVHRGWTPDDLHHLSLRAECALHTGVAFACDQYPSPDPTVRARQVQAICMIVFPLFETLDRTLGAASREWISVLMAATEEALESVADDVERTGDHASWIHEITAVLGRLAPYAWAAGIPLDEALTLTDDETTRRDLLTLALDRGFQFVRA